MFELSIHSNKMIIDNLSYPPFYIALRTPSNEMQFGIKVK